MADPVTPSPTVTLSPETIAALRQPPQTALSAGGTTIQGSNAPASIWENFNVKDLFSHNLLLTGINAGLQLIQSIFVWLGMKDQFNAMTTINDRRAEAAENIAEKQQLIAEDANKTAVLIEDKRSETTQGLSKDAWNAKVQMNKDNLEAKKEIAATFSVEPRSKYSNFGDPAIEFFQDS